jgi:pSer/pThr/pTyr-binding forkhead associated (FHA) protein
MTRLASAGAREKPAPTLNQISRQNRRPIRIGRPVFLLGSHSRVHLPLRLPMVSRAHALVVMDDQETYVRDLASRNGVWLSGTAVREARVRDGDILCIGPFAFRWRVGADRDRLPHHLAPIPTLQEAAITIEGQTESRPITARTLLIGSRNSCDLVLEDSKTDEVHAVIFRRSGKHFIRDLNSQAGTFVNARRIRESELRRGDQIRIGFTFLRFESGNTWANCDPFVPASDPPMEEMIGLAGAANADMPAPVATAPLTIEELLAASPDDNGNEEDKVAVLLGSWQFDEADTPIVFQSTDIDEINSFQRAPIDVEEMSNAPLVEALAQATCGPEAGLSVASAPPRQKARPNRGDHRPRMGEKSTSPDAWPPTPC